MDIQQYCEVDDCNNFGEKAHLITRATLPKYLWDDCRFYLVLCRTHHSEQHSIGIDSFCIKYGFEHKQKNAREELTIP